jgi:restriction system protein
VEILNVIDFNPDINFIITFGIILISAVLLTYIVSTLISNYRYRKYEERLSQAGMYEIDLMTGSEFEHYLELFFKKLGYRVKRTPASNDFGADLILDGEDRIVVQAKRYGKKVGVRAVQEVNSARDYYEARCAWVITNNFFTLQAQKLAISTAISLIDRDELTDMILGSKTENN